MNEWIEKGNVVYATHVEGYHSHLRGEKVLLIHDNMNEPEGMSI